MELRISRRPRSVGKGFCLALVLTFAAATASAVCAAPIGLAKPAYTKTTGNATFWWHWNAIDGNSNGSTDYRYIICYSTFHNGLIEEGAGNPNDSAAQHCAFARLGNSSATGTVSRSPYTASTVLIDGDSYAMCAYGYYYLAIFWKLDFSPNNCVSTTIDNNRPSLEVSVDGTASVTNNPVLALHIAYSDATSPPWFGANGLASNWTCLNLGSPCAPGGTPDPNCSARHFSNSRSDYFDCQADVTSASDGTWYFCAMAADAAIPDSRTAPSSAATSAEANLSAPACGLVTLDRAAPRVTIAADATAVSTGTLVKLTATSVDDSSGTTGSYSWDFGDGTPAPAGASTTHTFTRPGKYEVKAVTRDQAGNAGQGALVITVQSPPDPPHNPKSSSTAGEKNTNLPDSPTSVSHGSRGADKKKAGGGHLASACRVSLHKSSVNASTRIRFVPTSACGRVVIQRRSAHGWVSLAHRVVTARKGTRISWRARHAGLTLARGTLRG
jgi:hypothetical protein